MNLSVRMWFPTALTPLVSVFLEVRLDNNLLSTKNRFLLIEALIYMFIVLSH